GVGSQRLVHGGIGRDLHAASGGGGGAVRGGAEAPEQLVAVGDGRSAQVELRARVFRDDVGLLAALGDDAVDACLGTDLLAHGVQRVEERDHGVQRVDAPP